MEGQADRCRARETDGAEPDQHRRHHQQRAPQRRPLPRPIEVEETVNPSAATKGCSTLRRDSTPAVTPWASHANSRRAKETATMAKIPARRANGWPRGSSAGPEERASAPVTWTMRNSTTESLPGVTNCHTTRPEALHTW